VRVRANRTDAMTPLVLSTVAALSLLQAPRPSVSPDSPSTKVSWGTISAIRTEGPVEKVVLDTPSGPREIQVTSRTPILGANGRHVPSVRNLDVGQQATVFFTLDDTGRSHATEIDVARR
jgi:hypothetical protein